MITLTRGQVALLELDNQPLNLVTVAMMEQLDEALDLLAAERETRAVIVAGAGERAFCAGSDLREFADVRADALERKIRPEHEVLSALAALPVPTVCALDGPALGGGLELALACDLRIASASAVLGLPESRVGGLASSGAQRLARLIGPARAKELLFTGDSVGADEALRTGLVNRVVPAADLLDAALALASDLAAKPPLTLAAALAAVHRGMDASIDDGLAIEEAAFARIVPTHDAQEGVAAFVEKRPPTFLGR